VHPRLHKKLPRHQEALAQSIVASGRMRLVAGNEGNFTRILLPGVLTTQTITHRELNDPVVAPVFRERLVAVLASKHEAAKIPALVDQFMERARTDLQKRQQLPPELEIKMARALVLCNEYPVIHLIHLEGAEIYISYGQSVGDVMDVVDWQQYGSNNGMQAAGAMQNAVYVSCGGHPFLDDDERTYTSDGFPALSRFMVIAAQETGHNADMIRSHGQWVGRHSAEGWQRAPSEAAGIARRRDLRSCDHFYNQAKKLGLNLIVEWERHLKFYRDQKVGGTRRTLTWLKCRLGWQIFRLAVIQRGMKGQTRLQSDQYPATLLSKFFQDMRFNLDPQADVYRRDNPLAEEAVTCIEAVARVPQQVVKWGHQAVYATCPNLYVFYYHTIVPACERTVRELSRPSA
jgi:hypothetical protein